MRDLVIASIVVTLGGCFTPSEKDVQNADVAPPERHQELIPLYLAQTQKTWLGTDVKHLRGFEPTVAKYKFNQVGRKSWIGHGLVPGDHTVGYWVSVSVYSPWEGRAGGWRPFCFFFVGEDIHFVRASTHVFREPPTLPKHPGERRDLWPIIPVR